MKVSLVHRSDGAEALIAYMARVSNPKNQDNPDFTGLLRYMIREGHWSPFEMCSMCVHIETERDVAAQLMRHKSFIGFQEFSQRYAQVSIAEIPHFRRQDKKNRQSSHDDFPEHKQQEFAELAGEVVTTAYRAYYKLLEEGAARECARRLLPLCSPTVVYAHASLRSWIHYITARTHKSTQAEHREVAEAIKRIFVSEFPVIAEAAFNSGEGAE